MDQILSTVQLSRLKSYASSQPHIIAIYLHGSRITGNYSPVSDLDVTAVVGRNLNMDEKISVQASIETALSGIGLNLDIKVVNLDSSPVFLFQTIKGLCVFSRSTEEKISLESHIMRLYYDTQHLRDIYKNYLYSSVNSSVHASK